VGRIRKFLVAGACAATLTAVPGAALATPPSGVTAEVLAGGVVAGGSGGLYTGSR
jgi:hypothetical protein